MHDHHDGCGCGNTHKTEESPKCISEFVSRNDNYKGVVYELPTEPKKYEAAIYHWTQPKDEEPLWERIAGPVVLDTQPAAETWVQQNLSVYAGERLDNTISDQLRSEVLAALGHDDFDFLDPQNFAISFLESEDSDEWLPIPQVEKLLAAGDFYFVEWKGSWLAGFLYDEATIRCWKRFEDLKSALIEIV